MENITKRFGSVVANNAINMELREGEILSLLGENGSGKTTLMNMLSGIYFPDEGQIYIHGKPVTIASPKDAFNYGIGMIHQHFKLVDVFTATENIVLGLEGKLDLTEAGKKVKEICDKYGFDIDPNQKIYDMSVSQKQTVEIVKVLFRGADILILDEPTAVLTPQETDKLFQIMRNMKADGKSLIIITNKLHEVLDVSDRVAVLRKGEYIGDVATKDADQQSLTDMMVGHSVSLNIDRPDPVNVTPRLVLDGLTVFDELGVKRLDNVSFTVNAGEVLGVAGVAGGTGNGDGVRLMSCQVFSGVSNPSDEVISRAIKYAADHGASILQCSYGTSANFTSDRQYEENSPLEIEALLYFMAQNNCAALDGGLAIYSAGNESKNISNFPGGYSKCISVTSVGPDCLPAYYTCYGQGCNIAAPGGETVGFSGGERAGILSTTCSELTGSDYGYMQGTSMACPHMSGVAALGLSYALSKGKHYTRDEFISMLLTSVNEIDSRFEGTKSTGAKITLEDYRGKMGTGLTDAYQLLMQIEGTPCLKVSTNKLELITLTKHFGGSAQDLTYLDVEMSKEDMDKLGISSAPKMYNGQLMIKCTKPGVARIKVSAVGGGTRPGSETIMGGIEISKEFAIIARETGAENGGWL